MRFYCKQLQNGGALYFVQFFLDHSVYIDISLSAKHAVTIAVTEHHQPWWLSTCP